MRVYQALDLVPLWVVSLATLLVFLAAIEVGFRLGRYRRRMPQREGDAPSGTMVAATLGLLGFMLAFTFGMAGSRFDSRKHLVLDEANAIGTAFLRSRLLPAPQSAEIQELLKKYVSARLLGAETPDEIQERRSEEALRAAIVEAEELHGALWSKVEALVQAGAQPVLVGLFAQSLNEVIDLHGSRVAAGIRFRIPPVIWITLALLSTLGMVMVGFHGGLASPRRSMGTVLVTLAFVVVLLLIVDLDRGQEGFLQVGQDALFDVRSSMEKAAR